MAKPNGTGLTVYRRPEEDTNGKTGLGRYADVIEYCLEGRDYDIVISDATSARGYWNMFVNGFWRPVRQSRKLNTKDTVCHATDELCSMVFPFVKGKKIMTVHHVSFTEGRFDLFYRMWMLITKTGIRKSCKVITISETTKQDLIRIGCPEEKIVVIVNRVDPKFRKKDLPKRHSVFCMGQLAPRKNMEDALRAFIELSGKEGMGDWTITFCGDGPNRDNILSMASEAGISERVKIVTGISEEEVIDLYNEAMLVFNTSLLEGTGLVTLEAQRCGTPVLHLNRAQIPEPVTRLSVGCEDPSDMAEKAYALISDPEAYDDLCRRSKEYADAFGGDFKERYLALLEEVRNS